MENTKVNAALAARGRREPFTRSGAVGNYAHTFGIVFELWGKSAKNRRERLSEEQLRRARGSFSSPMRIFSPNIATTISPEEYVNLELIEPRCINYKRAVVTWPAPVQTQSAVLLIESFSGPDKPLLRPWALPKHERYWTAALSCIVLAFH
ncbi:hypothetical protein EVAR_39936_1 [Eumeta japonica]|uniref:Uncharacterized protein n=1 Tax=Eumeta variegata TaxID=151549 RepID=A0A4C1X4S2_EUMVA|nr:hypothetical protein EVAR_39936_1 [Eumeta japonica]